jgi:putative ATP-binding cassette transporter
MNLATTAEAPKKAAGRAPPAPSATKKGNETEPQSKLLNVSPDALILMYWGMIPIVIIFAIVFECVHRRWAGIDLNEPIDGLNTQSEAGQGMRVRTWMKGFWPLTQEFFFKGDQAGLAKMLIFLLLFLSFFKLFMDWARNIWQKDFWDAIEGKQVKRFWKAMCLFVQMAVVNVLSSTYQDYATSILMIRWRAALTKSLQERWLLGRAFYTQHFPIVEGGSQPLDNPDQRLQEDVDAFIQGGVTIFFGFFMCIGRLALFTPILFLVSPNKAFGIWYCPGWLLYVSLLYSFLGSMFTHLAGRYLIPLSFIKQSVEADYRHTAIQVRDHTESIALYGSEATENTRLSSRFDRIQRVVWEQMKFSKQLGFFRSFYFLSNDVAPFMILAGNYFRGQITLGELMQILGALGHVSDSLNAFVQAYTSLADFRATTDRLYNFWTGVDQGAKFVGEKTMSKEVSPPGDTAALYAQEVCVDLPGERKLWDNAGLVVQPGERVLLLGPDGCGKSIFLRSVAGCWPATGSVRIGRGDALFIPQRPFVPAGELRDALAYPEPASQYIDEEMIVALQAVKLTALWEVPLSEHAD